MKNDPEKYLPPFLPFFIAVLIWIVIFVFCFRSCATAETIDIDEEKLATAIWHAEGGAKTRHPYGILAKYKQTTPRQACINTIRSAKRRYIKTNQRMDFIKFLSLTYCPIGAKNDPSNLNTYWLKNVRYFLTKG